MDRAAVLYYREMFKQSKKNKKSNTRGKINENHVRNINVKKNNLKKKDLKLKLKKTPIQKSKHKKNETKKDNDASRIIPESPVQKLEVKIKSSIEIGLELFEWLIYPTSIHQFFSDFWEKKHMVIKRNDANYYSKLGISLSEFEKVIETNDIFFGEHLDVALYKDGKRETLTPKEFNKANLYTIKKYFDNGCSLRLLNPQTYFNELCKLNKHLSEYFGSMVGANLYLTPANKCQGFAPHYDDIEAFVLQLEGQKVWKIYSPTEDCRLPRVSSGNFTETELGNVLETVTLNQGDLLYFPRGFIHQANTMSNKNSIHVTISTYQKNCWADFLENLVPAALKIASDENPEFRQGLPLNYLHYMGLARNGNSSHSLESNRNQFKNKLRYFMNKLIDEYIPDLADEAADQMGRKFMHDSLPPNRIQRNHVKLGLKSVVRLLNFHCLRIINDVDGLRMYYNVDNSSIYHLRSEQFLELEKVEFTAILEQLIKNYPQFILIKDLVYDGDDNEKIAFIEKLLNIGVLVIL